MGYRTARRIHVLLMSWLTLVFVTAWLPLLRGGMDGPSYEGGATLLGMRFGGSGTGGDYWFVAVKAVIGVAMLGFGWRRPNGPFRLAMMGWLALAFADTLYSVVTAPETFRFRGDTLGVDVSLAVVAPALDAAMLALATWWATRAPALPVPPLARANFVLLATAAALLPVQYLLLSRGSGQETSDVVGVLLTMAGWALFSAGLGLWRLGAARPVRLAAAT
jgi:hypothetical protein